MTVFEIVLSIVLLSLVTVAYMYTVKTCSHIRSLEKKVDTLAKVLAEYEQRLNLLKKTESTNKFKAYTRTAR